LDDFAKKLIVLLNSDLDPDFIHKLGHLFSKTREIIVTFEIMELEKVKK
jgi:DNA polymerase-3 subunit alpha